MAGEAETKVTTPAPTGPTFIDEPGPIDGVDALLGIHNKDTRPQDEDEEDFGFDDEDEADDQDDADGEDEDDDEDGEGDEPRSDPAILAQLTQQSATIAQLQATLSQLTSTQQQDALDDLLDQLEEAKEFGQDDKVADLRKRIGEVRNAASSAPATNMPANQADFQQAAQTWLSKQEWYGRDYSKTAKLREVTSMLDPSRFSNPQEYIAAVEKEVLGSGGKQNTQDTRQRPAPKGGGAGGAPRSRKATFQPIKSIDQLKGKHLEAAQTAIRMGAGEAEFIASYNSVQKAQFDKRNQGSVRKSKKR